MPIASDDASSWSSLVQFACTFLNSGRKHSCWSSRLLYYCPTRPPTFKALTHVRDRQQGIETFGANFASRQRESLAAAASLSARSSRTGGESCASAPERELNLLSLLQIAQIATGRPTESRCAFRPHLWQQLVHLVVRLRMPGSLRGRSLCWALRSSNNNKQRRCRFLCQGLLSSGRPAGTDASCHTHPIRLRAGRTDGAIGP